MRKLWIIGVLIMMGCGVGLETLTLTETTDRSSDFDEAFRYFRAPLVFRNDLTNIWGLESDECKNFEAVNLDDEHGTALKLDWNKTTCDWVGFGIGWNNWQPKDLAGIMEGTDLVMDLRAINNEAGIPVMVFLLEDYAGVMSAAVGGAHCLESYPIDQQWQTFRLPMSDFDYRECGIDLTNVKQLVIEVQGRGEVIVDNIRIEEHSAGVAVNKKVFPPHSIAAKAGTVVFGGTAKGMWGLGAYPGRDFSIADGGLHLNWQKLDEPHYHRMGISWEDWKNVDMTSLSADGKLRVELKEFELGEGDLKLVIESYDAGAAELSLKKWMKSAKGSAATIDIPLMEFRKDVSFWKRIKQLQLITEGKGKITIERIEIVGNGN